MNKCPTCKPIISKTIVCPESVPCPTPAPCSEILDSACFQYEDSGISLCNSTVNIVQQFDALELILQKFTDAICTKCNINIDITAGMNPSLISTVTGGTAPYTYDWSIKQGPFVGHTINGSTTSSTLLLDCISANGIETPTIDKFIKITDIYLKVTDAKGCISTVYYYYTSDCYNQIITTPEPRTSFLGGKIIKYNAISTPFAQLPMDFMDNPDYIPTCDELKHICCDIDGMSWEDAHDLFKANQDIYTIDLTANMNSEYVSEGTPNVLNYTQYKNNNLGDKTIFYKGGLENYNFTFGCPEYTYAAWSEITWSELNGDTIKDRLPSVDYPLTFLPPYVGILPVTGLPGQLIKNTDTGDTYAWDEKNNQWSLDLANCIENIFSEKRAKRNAWTKALNELILATKPFTWANDYAPFHRFKNEIL